MRDFDLVPGPAVHEILRGNRRAIIDLVRLTYINHETGGTINPDSLFLRFPDKPDSRIIALPAFLGADVQRAGIKWISSFPANTRAGIPRASAVLILNDYRTGYPIACLEASTISSARTAASAALAATVLRPTGYQDTQIAVVGAGVIARNVCDYLIEFGCCPDVFLVHDRHRESGDALVMHLCDQLGQQARFTPELDTALAAETIVFTTTANAPYVSANFRPGQLVLNLSLRDISPEAILAAANIFDDIEHCLKADTSPHLAEQVSGTRHFATGTLAGVILGTVTLPPGLPVIFSPFGLGVLDVAVGNFVHQRACAAGTVIKIPDFFAETRRW